MRYVYLVCLYDGCGDEYDYSDSEFIIMATLDSIKAIDCANDYDIIGRVGNPDAYVPYCEVLPTDDCDMVVYQKAYATRDEYVHRIGIVVKECELV